MAKSLEVKILRTKELNAGSRFLPVPPRNWLCSAVLIPGSRLDVTFCAVEKAGAILARSRPFARGAKGWIILASKFAPPARFRTLLILQPRASHREPRSAEFPLLRPFFELRCSDAETPKDLQNTAGLLIARSS